MKLTLTVAICLFAITGQALAQNTSSYTSTRTSACRTIESNAEEGGSYIGECRGIGGYRIQVLEGDIRQTINVITPAKKKFELNFWGVFSSFSSIGEKVEWRLKKGVPVALIARYNVADPEGVKKDKSYLLVSKISKTAACVTDVVDPGPKQNETARQLADSAASKPCKITD